MSLSGVTRSADTPFEMSPSLMQFAIGLFGLGFGLFWLYRAFATGRALGRFGFADRATRPVGFWLHVVALVGIVLLSSMQVVLPVLKERTGFRALHPVAASAARTPSSAGGSVASGCGEPGPAVCFVAVGAAPDVPVETLARYYSALIGSPVGVLAPVALTREAGGLPLVSAKRSQVGIDALTRLIRDTYPSLWGEGVTVVILTANDLWLEARPDWRYSFGGATSRRGGGGFAVVSTARLDPAAYGQAPNPEVLQRRVHALIGKYLALLRYGERASSDPASPVYDAIRTPADLDRMQAFAPPR
jgi:hypothetical protein